MTDTNVAKMATMYEVDETGTMTATYVESASDGSTRIDIIVLQSQCRPERGYLQRHRNLNERTLSARGY